MGVSEGVHPVVDGPLQCTFRSMAHPRLDNGQQIYGDLAVGHSFTKLVQSPPLPPPSGSGFVWRGPASTMRCQGVDLVFHLRTNRLSSNQSSTRGRSSSKYSHGGSSDISEFPTCFGKSRIQLIGGKDVFLGYQNVLGENKHKCRC